MMLKSKPTCRKASITRRLGYSSEQQLRDELAATLKTKDRGFGSLDIAIEFSHASGRTDIIAQSTEGELIAFETKLLNWRAAMQQAYRNSSFAHYSYVALPTASMKRAIVGEFVKRKIGLCSVDAGCVRIEVAAPKQEPLQPWITKSALSVFGSDIYAGTPSRSAGC